MGKDKKLMAASSSGPAINPRRHFSHQLGVWKLWREQPMESQAISPCNPVEGLELKVASSSRFDVLINL